MVTRFTSGLFHCIAARWILGWSAGVEPNMNTVIFHALEKTGNFPQLQPIPADTAWGVIAE